MLASLAAMLVLLHPGALNAEEEGGPATSFVSRSSPTAERLAVGLSPSGSLLPCSSSFNCVSTASRAAEAYVGPWQTDGQATAAEATAALRDAALALFPGAAVAEEGARPPHGAYLRLRVPGRFPGPPDEMEFLVRDHGVGDRGWAGDDASRGSLLVTMRSSAARSVFVYPFTVSVSDGGLQAQRLRELRARLGWRLVGCELAECYGQ